MTEPKADIRFDAGRHWRGKIGFVLLSSEQTVEDDMFAMVPRNVGVHFARAPMSNQVNAQTLREMIGGIAPAAAQLLPEAGLDVVCYACTSGSIVNGEQRVMTELRTGAPSAIATTLVTGVVAALRALTVRRVVVATPYLDDINELERTFLRERGFGVVSLAGLQIADDSDIVRVSPDYLWDFVLSLDWPSADAIFISCSALRSIELIEELEQRTGKPVVTSNQAMAWHTMRLLGVDDRIGGYGRLLREC